MSAMREIANALAGGLDAVEFEHASPQPAVQRKTWVQIAPEDMANVVIYVTPGPMTLVRVGRGMTQTDYEMSVFVGRLVATEADADQMMDLAEEILSYLRAHDWDNSASWPNGVTSPMAVTCEANPDDAANDRNVWRAVLTATYRVFQPDEV